MRPFEVVLVVLALVGLFGRWLSPVVQRLLAGALAVVAVVHVVVEGPRWQLVPAYVRRHRGGGRHRRSACCLGDCRAGCRSSAARSG